MNGAQSARPLEVAQFLSNLAGCALDAQQLQDLASVIEALPKGSAFGDLNSALAHTPSLGAVRDALCTIVGEKYADLFAGTDNWPSQD